MKTHGLYRKLLAVASMCGGTGSGQLQIAEDVRDPAVEENAGGPLRGQIVRAISRLNLICANSAGSFQGTAVPSVRAKKRW